MILLFLYNLWLLLSLAIENKMAKMFGDEKNRKENFTKLSDFNSI